jgi:hypothetical protein
MPFAWAAGIAAVGGIASAVIGGNASQSAAQTQASSSDQAAQIQQNEFDTTQKNLSPYLQSGTDANSLLLQQLGITPSSTTTTGTGASAKTTTTPASFNPNAPLSSNPAAFTPQGAFNAPGAAPTYTPLTAATFQSSPGYNYALQQSQQAIQQSAAASGGAIGGNTLMALQSNAVGLADQNWNTANNQNIANFGAQTQAYNTQFNAALSGYQENQAASVQDYTTMYDATRGNQNYLLSALQGLSGSGQNAAANLGSLGAQSAQAQGGYLTDAGNALAAGQIGTANAAASGLGSVSNSLGSYLLAGNTTDADPWAGAGGY